MENYQRYAVYYAPPAGALHDLAAQWLGWDPTLGESCPHPDLALDAARLTQGARKYGFHATLRAPFRLADGVHVAALQAELAALAQRLAPVTVAALRVSTEGGFVALRPQGDLGPLQALAAEVVAATNGLRAALNAAEIAKRRPDRLSLRQRMYLDMLGYPHVMEDFHFHLTLSDALEPAELAHVAPILQAHFAPHLPEPFPLEEIALFGEDAQGRFHLIHRYQLCG